jgi:uncharacterized phage protein (TIGR02218 family)
MISGYDDFFNALRRPSTGVCHCWRVTRIDGTQYLFTDHEKPLTVNVAGGTIGSPTASDELTFTPINSMSVTATKKSQGLAVDNLSVIGLIDPDDEGGVTERDVIADLFADAAVEIWLCCWTDLSAGLFPLKSGTLGQMTFRTTSFEAEMRGLAERLQRQVHRAFSIECDAVLGDSRCGADLDGSPGFRRSVTVTGAGNSDNRTFTVDLNEDESWAQYGLVTFTSGLNNGLSREIIDQTLSGGSPGVSDLTLLIPMPFDVQIGDTLTVTAGCDKTASTCKNKFDNLLNYRGFNFMPLLEVAGDFPDAK